MRKSLDSLTNDRKDIAGLTLIEILLVVGLIGLVGAALVRLGTTALTASDAGRARAVATQLADEALELVRAMRDSNSSDFFADSFIGTSEEEKCYRVSDWGGFSCPTSLSSPASEAEVVQVSFKRYVKLKRLEPDKVKVTAYVFWNQEGTWARVVLSTILTRWR